jgi:hypothetical protein
MVDWLSPEESLQDHVEIVGFGTAGLAGISWVVYFGAIFFYAPLRNAPGAQHVGLLALLPLVLVLALLVPRHVNTARLLLRLIFLGVAFTASVRLTERLHWGWGLCGAYSVYAAWVLGHPVALRFFRPLRSAEQQRLPAAGWLAFHSVVLILYLLGVGWRGWERLLPSAGDLVAVEAERGLLQVTGAIGLAFLVIFLQQAHAWARWALAGTALFIGLAALPATMNPRLGDYWNYWQALALAGYFLFLFAYLVFSPSMRRVFIP